MATKREIRNRLKTLEAEMKGRICSIRLVFLTFRDGRRIRLIDDLSRMMALTSQGTARTGLIDAYAVDPEYGDDGFYRALKDPETGIYLSLEELFADGDDSYMLPVEE